MKLVFKILFHGELEEDELSQEQLKKAQLRVRFVQRRKERLEEAVRRVIDQTGDYVSGVDLNEVEA